MAEDIKKRNNEQTVDNFAINETEVHVMPNKFIIQNPKKKDSGAKGIIVFFIIFFVLLMVGLGFGYYLLQKKNKAPDTNTDLNQNINQNTNQNTNTNANLNQNTNQDSNQNTNNENNNQNSNVNTNTNTVIVPPQATADSDQDGLTDLEEQTYQTDVKISDSDKDGYQDGDEVKNLYNPLASIQKLIDSGLVIRYSNDLYAYEIFSPKGWLIKAIDDSRQKIEFIPDNSTTEFVHLEAWENTTRKSLLDWQKSLYGVEPMENFQLGNQIALRSLDKKKVLVVNGDYVYTIVYDISSLEANFETTFEMMLASFIFSKVTP